MFVFNVIICITFLFKPFVSEVEGVPALGGEEVLGKGQEVFEGEEGFGSKGQVADTMEVSKVRFWVGVEVASGKLSNELPDDMRFTPNYKVVVILGTHVS